jgi:hypothetical protein
MTLLQRAINFLYHTPNEPTHIELLELKDIISSISTTSNEWNLAASQLAADHERNPGKRLAVICYPAMGLKNAAKVIPRLSTMEWNALALGRIYGEQLDDSSNPAVQGTLRDEAAQRPWP